MGLFALIKRKVILGRGSSKFEIGDNVLLVDRKGRRAVFSLKPGRVFSSHLGPVSHDDFVGLPKGTRLKLPGGSVVTVLSPTLADQVLGMPRGAQVIYPKDLGSILIFGDINQGCRVLEAGVGSGALSMAMLSVGATVVGYEIREDFANRAQKNVVSHLGPDTEYSVELRDIYNGIDGTFDRIVLDLPEPWRVVEHARRALKLGGIFVSYLPTIGQVETLRRELDVVDALMFKNVDTFETLMRSWHIEGQSTRPDHRMVAHTGFITTARLVGQPERWLVP